MCFWNFLRDNAGAISAIAGFFQAVFAAILVFWYIRKQTKISEAQTELSQKIYEFAKLPELQGDYNNSNKIDFWNSLKSYYKNYKPSSKDQELPETIEILIEDAGFPSGFEPSKVDDLQSFVYENMDAWSNIKLWQFVRTIFNCQCDDSRINVLIQLGTFRITEFEGFHKSLLMFFEKWIPQIDDISKYFEIDPKELVILTWLELARVREIKDFWRPGEREFFHFAKTKWESYIKTQQK